MPDYDELYEEYKAVCDAYKKLQQAYVDLLKTNDGLLSDSLKKSELIRWYEEQNKVKRLENI